jgi:hypothetical protein
MSFGVFVLVIFKTKMITKKKSCAWKTIPNKTADLLFKRKRKLITSICYRYGNIWVVKVFEFQPKTADRKIAVCSKFFRVLRVRMLAQRMDVRCSKYDGFVSFKKQWKTRDKHDFRKVTIALARARRTSSWRVTRRAGTTAHGCDKYKM